MRMRIERYANNTLAKADTYQCAVKQQLNSNQRAIAMIASSASSNPNHQHNCDHPFTHPSIVTANYSVKQNACNLRKVSVMEAVSVAPSIERWT